MSNDTPATSTRDGADQSGTDFNTSQWRFATFAVRKSCRWSALEGDPRTLVIERIGAGPGSRSLCLYQSGLSRTGVRVALIDPTADAAKRQRWLTQYQAWALLTDGGL
ncbi:hypothetical protein [Nocardioides sp. Leaf285]|uniref:hypothetical protein n=1 Tax=Nocardioides sp. Leaf285 TaxID=1736322 RepID=UPI00070358C3|nr:hypothetical protein [Nocardioides sp. Leaf285]KQP62855.1 hypothetical protein ASF47_17740 [Nocardioides sp. Leaf285]